VNKILITYGGDSVNKNFLIIGIVVVVIILAFIMLPKNQAEETMVTEEAVSIESGDAVDAVAEELYTQAATLNKDQQFVQAKEVYTKILSEHPEYQNAEGVSKELEDLNMKMVLTNVESQNAVIHEAGKGDTLGGLAKKYGTTIELIKKRNNLSNNVIRLGQKISVWTAPFNIFVDKSQNILMLKQGADVIKTYTVATGLNNSTPVGTCKIDSKLKDPVWFKKGVVVPPESPENELGTRWLGFDAMQGYGIHGTIKPETIGSQSTAGCVRMLNEQVDELYDIVPLGTEVTIQD
jgi:lipoprotein-anchoring transpeptidase ErfK/SrfK